jgi:hypothetical protein
MVGLFLVLGIILFSAGFTIVHRIDKASPLFKRLGGVMIAMSGVFSLWAAVAFSVPVLIHEKIRIVGVTHNTLIVKVTFNLVRECKTGGFMTYLVKNGVKTETQSIYVVPDKDAEDIGYTIIINSSYVENPDHFILQFKHECPLGVDIISEFPPEPIPNEFNATKIY